MNMDDAIYGGDPSKNSPQYVTQLGKQIYLDELRQDLEKQHFGEYVVIEVESKKHFVNKDLTAALQEAEKEFPNKLFYIVRIGTLQKMQKLVAHDWVF